MKEKINEHAFFCTDIASASAQYPRLIKSPDGGFLLCAQQFTDGKDQLTLANITGDNEISQHVIETAGDVLQPVMHTFRETTYVAWAEHAGQSWRIMLGAVTEHGVDKQQCIAEGEAVFTPYLFDDSESLMILYTEQHKKASSVMLAKLQDGIAGAPITLSQSGMAYRPTGCRCANGDLIVAYDRYLDGSYTIAARALSNGGWGSETVVSNSAAWATSPEISARNDGALIVWYEIAPLAEFRYLTADLALKEGEIELVQRQTVAVSKGWYQNVALSVNEAGHAAIAYTWDKYNIHVRKRIGMEPWSEPVTASFDDGHCAMRPSIVLDAEDQLHVAWQFSHKNGHYSRNAAIVYNRISLRDWQAYSDSSSELVVNEFVKPILELKTRRQFSDQETTTWLRGLGYDGRIVFGDIHGQSSMSDGMGEVDQYFHAARDHASLDFTALTDHDTYTDWISESEWEFIRTTCRLMNVDGELSTILAYEWTPNEYRYDYGHKNVYYPGDDGEIYRSCDPGGLNPDRLFASVKAFGGMAIPHHVAALWGLVSAATDWSYHDESVQRISEVFSRHGSFEYFGARSKYSKNILQDRGSGVQDALARGYHLGLIAGSDSHQMEHGIEGGQLAAFVPSLTRKNVFSAIYDRSVYAITGDRILFLFRVNNSEMGQIIESPNEKANICISVKAFDEFDVELLRNNEVVARISSAAQELDYSLEETLPVGETCYYVRVIQKDEQMAWSSPIWVRYTL